MPTVNFNTLPDGGIDFNQTYTAFNQQAVSSATNTPEYPGLQMQLGMVAKGQNDSEFVFILAGANINLGDVCVITTLTQSAVPITNANGLVGLQVGVAQVAIPSGQYGWLQRAGRCQNMNVAASTNANTLLRTTATPGVLGTTVTGGTTKLVADATITANTTPAATVAGVLNQIVVRSAD